MNDPNVDWSLLPYKPVRFFGLNPDFDRRDLKRAYGKLIRRFKPETHPNEFQKIRRAYEDLENQVRYGMKQASMQNQTEAWNAVVASEKKPQPTSSKKKTTAKVSATESAIADPHATYRQLKDSPQKSPQDHFVLAVLSDLVLGKEGNHFLKWILQGVKKHPSDAGLQQVLREYLRTSVSIGNASTILQACSRSLRGEVFYRLTEPLWDRLLRRTKFQSVEKLLSFCEKNLLHKDGPARVAFYIHLLRPAIWKAPGTWTKKVMKYLEANGSQLDQATDHELEFLSLVVEYIREDRGEVTQSEIGKLLDGMMVSYCLDDWDDAVARVAQVQHEVARNSRGVVDAFPMSDVEGSVRLFSICMMIANDMAEQTAVGFDERQSEFASRQSAAALGDLRDSIVSVVQAVEKQRKINFILPFLGIVVVPFVFLLSLGMPFVVTLVIAAGAAAAFFLWLKPKVLEPRAVEKTEKILFDAYCEQWRTRLFRYIQSCGVAPTQALQSLQSAAAQSGDGDWMNVILSFIRGDVGLMLFGNAQMFVS